MAIPSRLKSALRPIAKTTKVITPTGIGVLLSVGAHAALIAFGPSTNVSFARLNQAAQEASAEESIVPLVQLSPAERNRLPSFAQPRRNPPSATGLGSLSLPSYIPNTPNNSTIRKRTVPANPIPSPTPNRSLVTRPSQPVRPLGNQLPAGVTRPFSLNFPTTTVPTSPTAPPAPSVAILPSPPPLSSTIESNPPPLPTDRVNGELPVLPGGVVLPAEGGGFSEALQGTQSAGIAANPAPTPGQQPGLPQLSDGEPSQQPVIDQPVVEIPVDPPVIATAPAQGNASRLINGTIVYDERGVSEEAAEERTKDWLTASAEGKETVAEGTAEIEIDSAYKACREDPPQDGRIGVLVNPDGSRENITVLKSIGYDTLNRLALSTLDYYDFGQPEVPTQYQVDVEVIYEPEDCVEALPDTP